MHKITGASAAFRRQNDAMIWLPVKFTRFVGLIGLVGKHWLGEEAVFSIACKQITFSVLRYIVSSIKQSRQLMMDNDANEHVTSLHQFTLVTNRLSHQIQGTIFLKLTFCHTVTYENVPT